MILVPAEFIAMPFNQRLGCFLIAHLSGLSNASSDYLISKGYSVHMQKWAVGGYIRRITEVPNL
jgi:hypothetical protein